MRVIQLVKLSLTKEKVLLEEELEKVINSEETLEDREVKIKNVLAKIVLNEQMLDKWNRFTDNDEQN